MEYNKMIELYKKQWIIQHGQPNTFLKKFLIEIYAENKAYKLSWIIEGHTKELDKRWRRERALRTYKSGKETMYI